MTEHKQDAPIAERSEIHKRLEGAFIICGLGSTVPPDWQVIIDAFVKSAQAQGHLARLASERYDKLLEMEREQIEIKAALSAAEQRERVLLDGDDSVVSQAHLALCWVREKMPDFYPAMIERVKKQCGAALDQYDDTHAALAPEQPAAPCEPAQEQGKELQ